MNEVIHPVFFPNKNDRMLFGILQQPKNARHDTAIVFLSPGIKSRVGPHRLYVKMAERFTQMGFAVLRVDPEGLGDSEGEIDADHTVDVYTSIQLGRYIGDTITIMDWMEQKIGTSRFILAGLCGGAITALLTAEKDARVHAILSMGIPCVLDGSTIDPAKYITTQQLGSIRLKYLAKLFESQAWIRFLSFKSDYRLLIQSLLQPLKRKKYNKSLPAQNDNQNEQPVAPIDSNLNPHFHRAFLQFVTKNKILLIFSGADRLYWEFEEKYLSIYKPQVAPFADNYRIEIVQEANHVFSFTEWQKEMMAISENWMKDTLKVVGIQDT